MISTSQNIFLASNDQKSLKPKPTKAVKLAFKALAVLSQATACKIRDRFAFHREELLQASDAIVPRGKHSTDRMEPRKRERDLLARVYDDHRLVVSEVTKAAKCWKLKDGWHFGNAL